MSTIHSVVIATDFSSASEAALARAVQVTLTHGASLCLLHAADDAPLRAAPAAAGPAREATGRSAATDARRRLAECARSVQEQAGIAVTLQVEPGPPAAVIDAYLKAHAPSLLVVGSRANPTLSGLGGTASELVRAPASPVLIVRAVGAQPYRKVMSAVDMREGSLRAATAALALFPSARHHLLHALDPAWDTELWEEGAETEQLRARHALLFAAARQELQRFAERLSAQSLHPVAAAVVDDAPARAILVFAADLPAECVVVGHHGGGPAPDCFLGSMAQHVIHAAVGDVLVVP